LAWLAGQTAIEQIASLIEENGIECEFRRVPFYLSTPLRAARTNPRDRKQLEQETTVATELGFSAEFLKEIPLVHRPGMLVPDQALFHPRKYLRILLERIPGRGSHVFEHSEAAEITEKPLSFQANGHTVTCDRLVLATNNPLQGITPTLKALLFQTKLALYTSYVVGAQVPKGLVPEGSWCDSDDPYYYLRVEPGRSSDYVIMGGEDHKTGQEPDPERRYRRVFAQLRKLVPRARLLHRWSGQLLETHDGLPYIGETAEGQFVATGYCGNGMTFATTAALMCRDWLGGASNQWIELFAPSRKPGAAGALEYIRENVDYPVLMVRDRLKKAEEPTPEEVGPGEGKIVRYRGARVAAYRDEAGNLTLLSPVCTHLGCLVNWNSTEKTWDCPCHGSRFQPDGAVLAGPAEEPLPPLPQKPDRRRRGTPAVGRATGSTVQ
jgi:glycine/D-amino acid oxidase-like deaminating enzyme/nitrite reductase/ring-hydroxylating ferredoxin subunit